jgi:hypothetical protein
MPVDIEEAGAVRLFVDQMVVPDLVVESAGLGLEPNSIPTEIVFDRRPLNPLEGKRKGRSVERYLALTLR